MLVYQRVRPIETIMCPPYTIIAEDECLYWEVHLGFFGRSGSNLHTPKLDHEIGLPIWQCFCLKASQISGQSQFRLSKLRFHQIDIKRLHTIQRLLHPLNSAQSVFCWPSEAEKLHQKTKSLETVLLPALITTMCCQSLVISYFWMRSPIFLRYIPVVVVLVVIIIVVVGSYPTQSYPIELACRLVRLVKTWHIGGWSSIHEGTVWI